MSLGQAIAFANHYKPLKTVTTTVISCNRRLPYKGKESSIFPITESLCRVERVSRLEPVHVMHECALAEVKATSGDNEVEVSLANELLDAPGRSTSKTFFRFERSAKAIVVAQSAVRFPIDVTFNKKEVVFQVIKCHGMNTI